MSHKYRPSANLSGAFVSQLVTDLKSMDNPADAMNGSLTTLCQDIGASHGLIWQIKGDTLVVVADHAEESTEIPTNGPTDKSSSRPLIGTALASKTTQQLMYLVLREDEVADTDLPRLYWNKSEGNDLSMLSSNSGHSNQVVVPLGAKGIFLGFLSLEFPEQFEWNSEDQAVVQTVGSLLSMVLHQCTQIARLKADAEDLLLLNRVLIPFACGGQSEEATARDVAKIIANRFQFGRSFAYFIDEEGRYLVSQDSIRKLALDDTSNPIVAAYLAQKIQVMHDPSRAAVNRAGDETKWVLPLVKDEKSLGILVLEEPQQGRRSSFENPYDRELAMSLVMELSAALARKYQ